MRRMRMVRRGRGEQEEQEKEEVKEKKREIEAADKNDCAYEEYAYDSDSDLYHDMRITCISEDRFLLFWCWCFPQYQWNNREGRKIAIK